MKKYIAIVNGKHQIAANTISALKSAASRAANNTYNSIDCFEVVSIDGKKTKKYTLCCYRMNKKSPNNEIVRGKWY